MVEVRGFSESVRTALESAGWSADRQIDIDGWVSELAAQGYEIDVVVDRALRSFGGILVEPVNVTGPNFSNDEPLNVDPILAGSGHFELARQLTAELGGNWFPFGEWLSYSSLFVENSGWTVATGMDWIWDVGPSVEEAIEFALMAHRPLTCLETLTPGVKPWPRQ
ncbi:SUKH-3 domain-containing protein [Kutzneria sp. NPDC052558]|uniref:SUKH-3 domain-containing protein n=1 Tax=Kutzneria sp. NPDC052558 TaxID=3364121 RepID=UPI0037C598A2